MKQMHFDRLMAVVAAEGPGEREGPLPRIDGQVVVGRPGAGWPFGARRSSLLGMLTHVLQFAPWQGWCSLTNGVPTPRLAPFTAGRSEELP